MCRFWAVGVMGVEKWQRKQLAQVRCGKFATILTLTQALSQSVESHTNTILIFSSSLCSAFNPFLVTVSLLHSSLSYALSPFCRTPFAMLWTFHDILWQLWSSPLSHSIHIHTYDPLHLLSININLAPNISTYSTVASFIEISQPSKFRGSASR